MSAMIRLLAAALALAFALVAPASAAPSLAGTWRTISDVDGKPRGLIRIVQSGETHTGIAAGTLVPGESMDGVCVKCKGERANQKVLGMTVLWGLKADAKDPLTFTGGQVLDPDSGNIYSARIKLAPDGKKLTLRGYIGNPLLGRSQTWERAD